MLEGFSIRAEAEHFPLREPFVVSGYVWKALTLISATVEADGVQGNGEGAPIFYKSGDSAAGLVRSVEAYAATLSRRPTRDRLLRLPPNGARNALDCALWDWESRRTGRPVWQLAGLPEPQDTPTVYTIGLDSPDAMGALAARIAPDFPFLKIKLGSADDLDVERARAVRSQAPGARLMVDANAGWSLAQLRRYAEPLAALGVEMLEQPLPPALDQALAEYRGPLPLCADESCQTEDRLQTLQGRFALINIKLDKVGGLTAALSLAQRALDLGFGLMVGNMLGTSRAMAPAFLLAQICRYADLDGPTNLIEDRAPVVRYAYGRMQRPPPGAWGEP